MTSIFSTLQYWLVYHPQILNFSWTSQAFASSPLFLFLSVSIYLTLTFLLPRLPLPTVTPSFLKPISAVHNFLLLLLSLTMAVGCSLSALHASSLRLLVCFPPNISPSGPLFFWAYVFYLSKILEFVDTLLIILSGSIQRLTFLHVYHHSTVLVMCYLWLYTRQSLFPVALVTNAAVHVIMYGYYLLCTLGIRPKWKRLVTDCQIVQFLFSFGISGLLIYYHFGGSGCSGMLGWSFNAVFNGSLLALFIDFHSKSYYSAQKKKNETLKAAKKRS